MYITPPRVRSVIRYPYLWCAELMRGQQDGEKVRPCVVIHHAQKVDNNKKPITEVFVCPTSQNEPREAGLGIEVSAEINKKMRLYPNKSWIVTTEVNRLIWQGENTRNLVKTPSKAQIYGYLPANLVENAIEQIKQNSTSGMLNAVDRDCETMLKQIKKRETEKQTSNTLAPTI